jgi:hypothetical protein
LKGLGEFGGIIRVVRAGFVTRFFFVFATSNGSNEGLRPNSKFYLNLSANGSWVRTIQSTYKFNGSNLKIPYIANRRHFDDSYHKIDLQQKKPSRIFDKVR